MQNPQIERMKIFLKPSASLLIICQNVSRFMAFIYVAWHIKHGIDLNLEQNFPTEAPIRSFPLAKTKLFLIQQVACCGAIKTLTSN